MNIHIKSKAITPIVVHINKVPITGVIINHLPEDQIQEFNKWLRGQTITSVKIGDDEWDFAYSHDYRKWHEAWYNHKIAEVTD